MISTVIQTAEGVVLFSIDEDCQLVSLETFTHEQHTWTLTPREGREHVYPIQIHAKQTINASQITKLHEWCGEAMARLSELKDAQAHEPDHTYGSGETFILEGPPVIFDHKRWAPGFTVDEEAATAAGWRHGEQGWVKDINELSWEEVEDIASEDPDDRTVRLAHGFSVDAPDEATCSACGETYIEIYSGKIRECRGHL